MHGAKFHSPYASIPCMCIHHHCTQVTPRTHQQLRTIRQVSCDLTPMSPGWRSPKGNLNAASASHRRAPASTTEQLQKPQIPQNQWKIWEKAEDFPWISLGLIETVRFLRCRDWGRDRGSTGQLPTANQTKYQRHYFIPSHLRLCPTSYLFLLLLFCALRFELSTVPQFWHTNMHTLWNSEFAQEITMLVMLTCLSNEAQRSLYVPHSGHYMYRTVVTICTASLNNSTFCTHSVFVCFVWIWE